MKIVIFLIFVLVTGLYYGGTKEHSGKIRPFVKMMFFVGVFFAAAAIIRYFGHGIEFGFTKAYSLKWFQSLGYVLGALVFILAAIELNYFMEPKTTAAGWRRLLPIFRKPIKAE